MIALGIQLGGGEEKPIDRLLKEVMNAAARLRGPNYNDGKEGWVNTIFIVPGTIFPPADFEGFKLGHYSKKERGVVVMIAVPSEVRENGDGHQFVEGALRQAATLAADKFKKKGDPFSFIKANRLIDEVMKSVANA